MTSLAVKKSFLYFLLVVGSLPFVIPLYHLVNGSFQMKDRSFIFPPDPVPLKVSQTAFIEGRWQEVKLLAKPGEIEQDAENPPDTYKVKRLSDDKVFNVLQNHFSENKQIYFQYENFSNALNKANFGRYLVNTIFIALVTIIGNILSCSLVGYAFARIKFYGKNVLFIILLAAIMLPMQVTIIPQFLVYKNLGLFDTYYPLILPAWFAGSAFFVFLFRQYFLTIPLEIEDAARADGCSPLGIYWHIMLPISKPVVVTVAIYSFMGAWNDLLSPLIYISSEQKRTLALGLANFTGAYHSEEPSILMAASLMMILPTIILFFFSQKALMEGMKIGAVKG
jgi:multiple sugar transport system permease protein